MSETASLHICGEVTGRVGSIISLLVRYPVFFIHDRNGTQSVWRKGQLGKLVTEETLEKSRNWIGGIRMNEGFKGKQRPLSAPFSSR